jgi:hypothetical protein
MTAFAGGLREQGYRWTCLKTSSLSKSERDCLSQKLGDGPGVRAKRRKEVEEMSKMAIGNEIKKTEEILRERAGATGLRNCKSGLGSMPLTMAILCLAGGQVRAFTAYDCSNRSNIIESYSLLEPDACAVSDKAGEVETTVYGEIVEIKQDRMITVFRCQVIETIVSQYCGHFSSAGVIRYIRREPKALDAWEHSWYSGVSWCCQVLGFRELKALEAWECCQARSHGKVLIRGRMVQATIWATVSHAMFLSGAMDDNSNCEVRIISLPNRKTLGRQTAQGLYEITLGRNLQD